MTAGPEYLGDLARHLRIPVSTITSKPGRRYTVLIECEGCERPVEFSTNKGLPPEAMAKRMMRAGWQMKPRRCPSCARAAAEIASITKSFEGEQTMEAKPPAIPTPDARAAQREVMRWLEEAFNVERGEYTPPISDASIAKDTQVSVERVAQLREQFYGPLKVPGEFAQLRRDVDALKSGADQLEQDAKAAATVIRSAADSLATKLEAIAQKNGWKV